MPSPPSDSLFSLLPHFLGQCITIEQKNDTVLKGIVIHVDEKGNIRLNQCLVKYVQQKSINVDTCFVRAKSVRCIMPARGVDLVELLENEVKKKEKYQRKKREPVVIDPNEKPIVIKNADFKE